MIVSTQLFEAYLDCPTKCWLRSRSEPATGNIYAEWAREQNEAYLAVGRRRLLAAVPESDRVAAPPVERNLMKATWRLAVELRLRTNNLESSLWAVERAPQGRGKPTHFVPYRFKSANKLTKNDRLSLAFDAFVLSEMVARAVTVGKIIHGDRYVISTVKLPSLVRGVQKRIKAIAALLVDASPPNLVLNRHYGQCEFQTRCRRRAIEKDELTLLSGMSENERKKFHDKGIFTVTQLSYTFRPRRRGRRSLGKQEKHHHSLRALAIRENRIHTVDLLEPKFNGIPVYLDVEGLPDQDFYYLIGVRVGAGDSASQYCCWADDKDGEKRIWNEFIDVISALPNPQIIHFGNYETVFLKRMSERYGVPREGSTAATAIKDALNLLSFIFARIYFPTFSNGLKEIASYLGLHWSGSPASGLESIVWRCRWEASKDEGEKQALLDYNREDCQALELVSNRLVGLHRETSADCPSSDVVRTSDMKRESPFGFKRNEFVLPEMETINKAAYWDYQRERVYVKSQRRSARKLKRPASSRSELKPNVTIEYPRPSACLTCKSKPVYRHGKRSKIVIDLKFMRHGIKRWVARHIAQQYRCPSCKSTFYPPDRSWTSKRYGQNLVAYAIYQTIELRLPQSRVAAGMNQLFGLSISRSTTNRFKIDTAQTYQCTYDELLKRLCSGRLLHVDETTVSVMGKDNYVWVLTSMEEVAYVYSPTREGSTIQTMLKSFSGVLVSDFYAAYDAIKCPQQKCLIHFIRDLNDELLNHPYDEGLKRLVEDFACLVKRMVETVDRCGLKKRFLKKHGGSVDRFYKTSLDAFGGSEAASKIVERLQKYRDKMFTFMKFDDVPWNNNNAEHAVKAFASLRRVMEGPTTEKGIKDFLVLLSICETCKYKNVNFLDFLRSGSQDIDDFANNQ
jgi:predicted RecB family nuclease